MSNVLGSRGNGETKTLATEKSLLATMFVFLLAVSNALWGSTVGISIFMDNYYGVEVGTIKGNMPDSIYYIFYLIFSFLCFFCNRLIPSLITALVLTLAGILVRITFYIPVAPDGGSGMLHAIDQAFSGINGTIAGNALIAAAQPFMFGYITTVTEECISKGRRGLYIGAATMFASFGYAVGYLVSIYKITSAEEFKAEFSRINYVYLAITCVLIMVMIVVLLLRHKEVKRQRTLATSGGFGEIVFVNQIISMFSNSNQRTKEDRVDAATKIREAKICVAVYSIIISISYAVSNYMENILTTKGLSSNAILLASSLYYLPGIIFPPIIGFAMDKWKKSKEICGVVIFFQVFSQTMVLFSPSDSGDSDNNAWLNYIYFWLTINSIATTCSTSALLTLVHELVLPQPDKDYNNVMYFMSILATLVIMLIPLPESNYFTMHVSLSVLAFVTVCIYTIFVVRPRKFNCCRK